MKVSSRSPRSSEGEPDGRSFQIVLTRSSESSFFQKKGCEETKEVRAVLSSGRKSTWN